MWWAQLVCCPWGLSRAGALNFAAPPFCSGPLSLDAWFHFIWFTQVLPLPFPRLTLPLEGKKGLPPGHWDEPAFVSQLG